MILLTLHLLSFPFEDDTKVNPYAGGDGEYRDACPSSLHRCLLDSPPKRVQPSPGLFAFWRRKWQPTPILLPSKFHGWRRLVGYSPWGCKESDTPERLHFLSLLLLLDWGRGKRPQPGLLQPPAWWAGAGSGGSFWAHTA